MKLFAFVALALLQASPASLDTVRQAYQAKNYAEVIKLANQMMPALTKSGTAADKAELLEMRGEAMLQQKSFAPAADSYTQAGNLAADDKMAALDRATGLLIKRSAGGKYTPKQPSTNPAVQGKQPIDILDETARKSAFSALYNDESKTLTAKSAAMEKATSLKPLMEGLKQIADLRYLEMAATGSDSNYQSATSGIVDHASKLMSDALATMDQKVSAISAEANKTTTQQMPGKNVGQVIIGTKRGLYSTDRNVLNEVINTSGQISQAAQEFAKAAGKSSSFDTIQKSAEALNKKATDVLNADYSTNTQVVNPPTVIQNPGSVQTPPKR